jgi:hypothetical protein
MDYWNREHEQMRLFRGSSANETGFDFAHPEPIRAKGLKYPAMYKFTHVIIEQGTWYMFLAGDFHEWSRLDGTKQQPALWTGPGNAES